MGRFRGQKGTWETLEVEVAESIGGGKLFGFNEDREETNESQSHKKN